MPYMIQTLHSDLKVHSCSNLSTEGGLYDAGNKTGHNQTRQHGYLLGRGGGADDQDFWLDPAAMKTSLNAMLVKEGLVYPTYYAGLPSDLRDAMTALAAAARSAKIGVWKHDLSEKGFTASKTKDLEALAIWPKSFRRLLGFFGKGTKQLSGFGAWLRRSGKDDQASSCQPATSGISTLHIG